MSKDRKFNLAIIPMLADADPDKALAHEILTAVNLSKYAGSTSERERNIVKVIVEEVIGAGNETPLPMSLPSLERAPWSCMPSASPSLPPSSLTPSQS